MKTLYRSPESAERIRAANDSLIEHWQHEHQMTVTRQRIGEASVLRFGTPDGERLILLHGHALNATMWHEFAPYLREYDCIAPDLIGQPGESIGEPFTRVDQHIQWLIALMDALHIERTRLIGLSMGGFLTLRLAAAVPERIVRAVALAPAGIVAPNVFTLLPAMSPVMRGMTEANIKRVADNVAGGAMHPETFRTWKAGIMEYHAKAFFRPRLNADDWRRLTMPVMIRVGTRDVFMSARQMERTIRKFAPSSVDFAILDGENHHFTRTFDTTLQQIALFLRG
ncbi:MAG: alpha/beta hydrolase [Anaerolineae bacterium]